MLERETTLAEFSKNWDAHTQRVARAHSEFSKVIAGTLNALTESRELIAEAGGVLARNGVFIAAQKSPAAVTMRHTPRRAQREIDENRCFATCMARLRPDERELLADRIAGWMAVYTDFGER